MSKARVDFKSGAVLILPALGMGPMLFLEWVAISKTIQQIKVTVLKNGDICIGIEGYSAAMYGPVLQYINDNLC